ncbi:hypothetical protein ABWW58_11025 [Sporolactobacillus sp. STCC-11]|uniref:hypothetical protein n=1 Tax=Sporolactobacillus caesalpiniae TaxID=3230362 RepID=UPI00339A8B0E
MENVVAKIESILDLHHNKNVEDRLRGFADKASKSVKEAGSSLTGDNVFFEFITKAFSYMQYVAQSNLPKTGDNSLRTCLNIECPGNEDISLNFELVKILDEEGIYELRVSLGDRKLPGIFKGARHFRAIFFPFLNADDELVYCFPYAYEKKETFRGSYGMYDPYTSLRIKETLLILKKSREDPQGFVDEFMF